jgi:hypothetical protein
MVSMLPLILSVLVQFLKCRITDEVDVFQSPPCIFVCNLHGVFSIAWYDLSSYCKHYSPPTAAIYTALFKKEAMEVGEGKRMLQNEK